MVSAGVTYAHKGDLLEITLYRPERRNALGAAEWRVLEAAINEAENYETCEFVLLRGEGEFFCSGVDLKWIEARSQREGDLLTLIEDNGATLQRLERLPQIVVAALNGPSLGIGVHLALCADIVLATRTSYLWIPEAKLGVPDVLHYRLIEQRMGRSAAMQMVLLGQKLSAEEAVSRGAIGQTYDDGQTLAEGVADHLSRLRAVSKPVRTAVKTYANTLERRADAPAQVAASAFVLERPGSRR